MTNPNRITRDQWISSFRKAASGSMNNAPGTFDAMMSSLRGSRSGGYWNIKLDTRGLTGAEYDIIENAVRRAFNDKRTDHHPDAIFNGIEVEVKHKPKTFDSFPTDSYGLGEREDKWYLFVMGNVRGTEDDTFTAWLMRSKELFHEVMIARGHFSPSDQVELGAGSKYEKLYIDPTSSTAISDIESQINDIANSLATNIAKKASGSTRDAKDQSMSLKLPVGANRVRLEIKFESKLRKIIADMIND